VQLVDAANENHPAAQPLQVLIAAAAVATL
jgi:hypothetical protein